MVTYRSLSDLDDAQADQRRHARMRIENAEQYVHEYRARAQEVQEGFHQLATREGVAADDGFREELRRASDIVHENVAHAGRRLAELEEEYDELLRDQTDERERFLADATTD